MSKVVKVSEETHSKLASMAKWGEPLDQVIQRLATQRGLEDVIAGTSSICFIDGIEEKPSGMAAFQPASDFLDIAFR